MTSSVDDRDSTDAEDIDTLLGALRRMGLVRPGDQAQVTALTGGVSSDIRLVELTDRRFCVKRALARLRVAAFWEAPISRNAAEVDWMRRVNAWAPGAAPTILGEDRDGGLFAMAYLEPTAHPVWKGELLAGRINDGFAAHVGRLLATIHARSATEPGIETAFAYAQNFEDLRLEPYLRATGRAHPRLASRLEALADRTGSIKTALMHGDVSPKNILAGPHGPVFLDAECACFGDPAFDLAFCLNHLLLKGARAGATRLAFRTSFDSLAHTYLAGVTWEDAGQLEARAASLLPALLLARIDGKSPVEYLVSDDEREAVRRFAVPFVETPLSQLAALAAAWTAS